MPKYKFIMLTESGIKDPKQENTLLEADDDLYAISKVLNHIGKEKFMKKQFTLEREVVHINFVPVQIPNLSELS